MGNNKIISTFGDVEAFILGQSSVFFNHLVLLHSTTPNEGFAGLVLIISAGVVSEC